MTTASLIAFAAEEAEHGNVALETLGYGVVALALFAVLGIVTLSYRNVANRHAHKADAYARRNPAPQPDRHGH